MWWPQGIAMVFLLMVAPCAEGAARITVTPMVQEIPIHPAGSETRSMALTNQGDEGVYIQVSLVDWLKDEKGESTFMEGGVSHPRSNLRWVRVEPRNLYLAPGAREAVRVTIEIPEYERIGAGSYWSMMVFEFFGEKPPPDGGVVSRPFGRLATGIYALVEPLVREAEVVDMGISDGDGRLRVTATIRNTGNAHLRCTGQVLVMKATGEEVARFPMPNALILPGKEAQIAAVAPGDLDLLPGGYTFLTLFDYGGDFYIAGEKAVKIGG